MASKKTKTYNETRFKLHETLGNLNYLLEIFGDDLAIREGYKEYNGLEAVQYFLMQKHNWRPSEVKSMSFEDLRFAMAEEMHGWKVPKDA